MAKRKTRKLKPVAKAAPRRKATKRAELPSPSRSLREKLVADLVQRIGRQIEVANAIAKMIGPKGEDLVASVPKLTVLELALDMHVGGLHDILTRAQNIGPSRAHH
jgi:hypothetical protein